MSFSDAQRKELLSLARESIVTGLRERRHLPCPQSYSPDLEIRRACFITLRIGSALRGCTGAIEAHRPIAEDVWHKAWSSAFNDPRFPPLSYAEYAQCSVHISVLSELEPMHIGSEAALVRELTPGTDGLLLRSGARQSTFLPTVWEQLRDPAEFVQQLKLKAGWPVAHWPQDIEALRYTTESFGEDD